MEIVCEERHNQRFFLKKLNALGKSKDIKWKDAYFVLAPRNETIWKTADKESAINLCWHSNQPDTNIGAKMSRFYF